MSDLKGSTFREFREKLRYSRSEIAQEIGVSEDAVRKWETELRPVPRYARLTLMRLCAQHSEFLK